MVFISYKNFVLQNFREELKSGLENKAIANYAPVEEILDKHAPLTNRIWRANDKPYD